MNSRTSTLLAMAFAGCTAAGCGDGATSSLGGRAAASACATNNGLAAGAGTKIYTFLDAAGTQSRVERTVRADGSETMWSETRPPRAGGNQGAASPIRAGGMLREYAELDGAGRLVYADVSLHDAAGAVNRTILDPQHGAVLLLRAGEPSRLVRGAPGAPWIYAPMTSTVTPVAAWIARRAAQAAADVRVFDAGSAESHGVMSDQLVFQDGRDLLVVLGDSAVSADDEFVTSVPLGAPAAPAACEGRVDTDGSVWRSG